MIDNYRNGENASHYDWTDSQSDARAAQPPPSAAGADKADPRDGSPRVRQSRSRRGTRTRRYLGEPVTVQLRNGTRIRATVVDESSSGLAIDVADHALFCRCQLVLVHQREFQIKADIRYVEGAADIRRVGLRLLPSDSGIGAARCGESV